MCSIQSPLLLVYLTVNNLSFFASIVHLKAARQAKSYCSDPPLLLSQIASPEGVLNSGAGLQATEESALGRGDRAARGILGALR